MWLFTLILGCAYTPTPDAIAVSAKTEATERIVRSRYFVPEVDYRDCAWPMCGGYFVDPPNRGEITCPDGSQSTECYVVEIDDRNLGLNEETRARFDLAIAEGRLLLDGRMTLHDYAGYTLARFEAVKAWEGQTGTDPSGAWARVEETGMLCLVEPCAHLNERLLNRPVTTMIAELDFGPSGADDKQITEAWEATLTDGLIVAGQRYIATGPGGTAPARVVTEFYTLLAP